MLGMIKGQKLRVTPKFLVVLFFFEDEMSLGTVKKSLGGGDNQEIQAEYLNIDILITDIIYS
jgi:hypothetical protein